MHRSSHAASRSPSPTSCLQSSSHWPRRPSYPSTTAPSLPSLYSCNTLARYNLTSIKTLFSGAAPLGADTEIAVETRLGVSVKQAYGMTELSPASHICPYPPRNKRGSVGPPLPSTHVAIVEPDSLQFLKRGELGEVWVRGPQVRNQKCSPVAFT